MWPKKQWILDGDQKSSTEEIQTRLKHVANKMPTPLYQVILPLEVQTGLDSFLSFIPHSHQILRNWSSYKFNFRRNEIVLVQDLADMLF